MEEKMKQSKSEEKHRHPWHFPKLRHRLCCLLSWLYEILSCVEYTLVLLPTGDVSSYRLPSESGGFFVFSQQLPGALAGKFPVPSLWWQQHFWLAPFRISHTSKPPLALLSNSLAISWQPCTSLPCRAYLGLGSGACSSGTWNSSPAHLGPAMPSVASSLPLLWQWFFLERQAPKWWLIYCVLECGGTLLVWNFKKHGQCLIYFLSLCHWQTGH